MFLMAWHSLALREALTGIHVLFMKHGISLLNKRVRHFV